VMLFSDGPATIFERDDEEQIREDHHDLDQPRDHGVDPTTEVADQKTHAHTNADQAEGGEDTDLERDVCTAEDAQEDVAAELSVGAENQERLAACAGFSPNCAEEMCDHGPTGTKVVGFVP